MTELFVFLWLHAITPRKRSKGTKKKKLEDERRRRDSLHKQWSRVNKPINHQARAEGEEEVGKAKNEKLEPLQGLLTDH